MLCTAGPGVDFSDDEITNETLLRTTWAICPTMR